MKFLGHVVSKDGIKVDPKKISAVMDWATPTDLSDLRKFLGLTNYFRKFIQGYLAIVAPLTDLTRAKVAFQWEKHNKARLR